MGYVLNKKNINIGKRYKLNTNSTGDTYILNKGIALKVFKKNIDFNRVLSEEDCKYLSTIRSDRILLPKKVLYYNDEYAGFSLNLLHNTKSGKIITSYVDDMISDIEMLEEDVDLLSRKRVLLDGVTPGNVKYSDGLYITDPSEFKILDIDNFDYKILRKLNDYQIQLLFANLICSELKKDGISESKINQFRQIIECRDEDIKPSKYYSELFGYSDNIKEFVKKM